MQLITKIKSFTGIYSYHDFLKKEYSRDLNRKQKAITLFGKTIIILGTLLGIHPFALPVSLILYGSGNTILILNKKITRAVKTKWLVLPIIFIIMTWGIILLFLTITQSIK